MSSATEDPKRRQPTEVPAGGQPAGIVKSETGTALSPDLSWPALGWEELVWESKLPPEVLSRSGRATMADPYLAALVPEIADLEVRLPRDTAAAAEEASVLIRDFDRDVGGDVAPFAAILLRSESASSSQIENLTSGAKQIAIAELGEDAKRNATLIVGNVHAMQAAIEMSDVVDGDTILAMHRALLEHAEPTIAGKWRDEPVWIGGAPTRPITRSSSHQRRATSGRPSRT